MDTERAEADLRRDLQEGRDALLRKDGYRRAWAHADATIEQLPLDAAGSVPWWRAPNRNLPGGDEAWWRSYRARLEAEARAVTDG